MLFLTKIHHTLKHRRATLEVPYFKSIILKVRFHQVKTFYQKVLSKKGRLNSKLKQSIMDRTRNRKVLML